MKKIFSIILKSIFVVSFLALNIGLFYNWYSDYAEKQTELEKLEHAQSKCTQEFPLYTGYLNETCVACDYPKAVSIKGKTKNPCPNRQIVEDKCCGGFYNLLPSDLKKGLSFGRGEYCNPEMFCDPPSPERVYFENLGIVFLSAFYILLLFGTLWASKVLKAKWMISPFAICVITWILGILHSFFLR